MILKVEMYLYHHLHSKLNDIIKRSTHNIEFHKILTSNYKLKQIYEVGSIDYPISSRRDSLSPKGLIILFGIVVVGIFLFFALFVFPIQNLFRESVSEAVTVISKSGGICVFDSQDHPRSISPCDYDVGDKLRITYKSGMVPVETHQKIG
jgi:hypothetical protein